MKQQFTILFIMTLILIASCKSNENDKLQYRLHLPETIAFKTGDSLQWANIDYDDSSWEEIKTGATWNKQGYKDYKGVAWYRFKVYIPSGIKKSPYFMKHKQLKLYLGKVAGADECYWNGEKIGNTGEIDPYVPERKNRTYFINPKNIRWNKENVLAIRVKSHENKGGLYKGLYTITTNSLSNYSSINFSTPIKTGLFEGNDSMKVSMKVKLDTAHPFDLSSEVICNVLPDRYNPDTVYRTYTRNFDINRGDSASIAFSYKTTQPGFYKFEFIIRAQGDTLFNKMFRVGYEPENIDYPLTRRDDFDEYWQKAREELAAIEPSFQLKKVDSLCTETANVYLVTMKSHGNINIHGWYTRPNDGKKHPGLLEVPFYGGALPPRISDYFCVFSLHTRGHGMSANEINPGFPEYYQYKVEDKDNYIYRGAYMDCIRAVDFLYSRNEVDTSKIAVYGVSQGGTLTFATAALDHRIKYAAARVPGFSNFPVYYQTVEEPVLLFEEYMKEKPGLNWETIYETLSYTDISNLAPWIQCPLMMTSGLQDNICPSVINFSAYNRIKGEKRYYAYANSGHGAGGKLPIIDMIREYFETEKSK